MRPLVISHAACAGHAPENTLAGIRRALELGADGIEIDVQTTADGVPVLMHDLTVDRTTNGHGELAKMSLAQLRGLDAGGEPPPTLADVLQLTKGRALLVAEIKQPGIEEHLAGAVREAEAVDDVMVWSFFPQALAAMRAAEPSLPGGLLLGPQTLPQWPEMRRLALSLGLQAVSVFCYGITEEIRRDTQRSGLALYAWTADPVEEIARLIALGVDGVCTNYPDRALALLSPQAS
ncbi:MAG: glycerophosphodiester phosphodiesterase [Dehalococcoidia bacterium]|nr:glycerophosphodiester phosphodiesterase [Dehalococcoidia bacterium]